MMCICMGLHEFYYEILDVQFSGTDDFIDTFFLYVWLFPMVVEVVDQR